jgi:hypothetical protein
MVRAKVTLLFCFAASICTAETFDIITRPTPPAGINVVIRIDRPNPQHPSTEYPQITFQPGDTITVHAGGCVQSGGHGSTWHRYVNPSGGDADHLYHGLITLPFATGVLERIQKYWNQSVHIADNADPARLHLQLGFEDGSNDYGDNGYTSHDDGPNNQCAGSDGGPAWVELYIVHHGAVIHPPATLSWDVAITDYDDNGIPLNPNWQSNVNQKQFPNPATCKWPWQSTGSPACTTGITNTDFDSSYGFSFYNPLSMLRCASCSVCQSFSANYGFGGHANWMAATYTGNVFWEEKSDPGADDEYSVNLRTPSAAGSAAGRPDGIHVEFDTDETIDILTDQLNIPWWKLLRTAVDGGDDQAHALLDNKFMIVTGLMGVDFAHTPGPESHPAWSLAIHANEDFNDDTWAFYVRNWGDEGYCSEDQHYISYLDNQYTFRFQWPAGATSGVVTSSNIAAVLTSGVNAEQTQITFVPSERAVLVTVLNVSDPLVHAIVGGEIHIAWSGTPTLARRVLQPVPSRSPSDPGEHLMPTALARMTPAQRAIYDANAPKKSSPAGTVSKLSLQVVAPTISRRSAGRHPVVRAVRDEALVSRRNAQIEAIKKAYGGTLPRTGANKVIRPPVRPRVKE